MKQALRIAVFLMDKGSEDQMTVSRKLGILVFCGVPAIVGGGILYAIYGSYLPIFIYEMILIFAAGSYISR
jgi:zinc transporter ZupT